MKFQGVGIFQPPTPVLQGGQNAPPSLLYEKKINFGVERCGIVHFVRIEG